MSLQKPSQDQLYLTLHKYWLQASLMRDNFYKEMDRGPTDILDSNWYLRIIVYRDFWLANLHTTICGYQEQKLNHGPVDNLICANKMELKNLKKRRDSTFHFETPVAKERKLNPAPLNMSCINEAHNLLGDYLLVALKSKVDNQTLGLKKPLFIKSYDLNVISSSLENYLKTVTPGTPLDGLLQYWLRARLMKAHFYREKSSGQLNIDQLIYLGSWYSALVCVIEGYQQLGFSDIKVNCLLDSENYKNLIKYRHSFTGYHRDYFNDPLIKSFLTTPGIVQWVHDLHDSLKCHFDFEVDTILETLN